MWDDSGNFFLVGAGPTATVLDPDNTPNNVLDVLQGGSFQVNWSFSGPATPLLALAEFLVQLYADPVGPETNQLIGEVVVPGAGAGPYETIIPIPTSTSPTPGILGVGAYRLTTLITSTEGGVSTPVAGFVDGPIIQVRPGP